MVNIIMMIIMLIILAGCTFYKAKVNKDKDYFMSVDYTKCLKGIMCIVVVLVHIPAQYSNVVQDAIGSFGYICVTFFFLFSAFGLMYSLDNKENYIKHFLKNRLLVLLIPFFISNLINLIVVHNFDSWQDAILILLGIKNISFITLLVAFYIAFYIVNLLIKNKKIAKIVLFALPLIYSILSVIFNINFWRVEILGLCYGIIIYNWYDRLLKQIKSKNILITIMFAIISIVLGTLYLKYKNVEILGDYLLRIVLGISLVIFIYGFTYIVKIHNKVLAFLGSISYEIYLLHGIFIQLFGRINVNQSWIFIYLVLGATIVGAYALNKMDGCIIKKIKKEKNI